MDEAYDLWEELEKEQDVKLIHQTGLLVFSEDPEDEYLNQVISSFEISGASRTVFESKEFEVAFPEIR